MSLLTSHHIGSSSLHPEEAPMPLTDFGLDELVDYRPELTIPQDFDEFWRLTLADARSHGAAVKAERVTSQYALRTVEVDDVRFPGWNGEPVAAWLLRPRGVDGPLPVVVSYMGYCGGRGLPTEHLFWSAAGYAQLVVDSRGQGHDTPDRGMGDGTQWVEGFMTRGIDSAENYYYRRLITDCVRAVDAVAQLPGLDSDRVVVSGGSQGGGLALAVAGLSGDRVAAVMPDVPFLCHFRHAVQIAGRGAVPGDRQVPALAQPAPRGADLRHPRLLRRRQLRRAGHRAGPVQRRPDGPGLPALHGLRRLQQLRGRGPDHDGVALRRPQRRLRLQPPAQLSWLHGLGLAPHL